VAHKSFLCFLAEKPLRKTLAPPGTGRLKRPTIVTNVSVARNTSRKGMAASLLKSSCGGQYDVQCCIEPLSLILLHLICSTRLATSRRLTGWWYFALISYLLFRQVYKACPITSLKSPLLHYKLIDNGYFLGNDFHIMVI
jgi:hypothetical protein